MNRLRVLLRKELRQHALLLLGIFVVVLPIAGLGLLGQALAPSTLTVFEAHVTFLRFLIPVFAMVVGNRLIVTEYQHRSQLFLAGLPLRRWEMVAVKWALGQLALLLVTLLVFGVILLFAWFREPLSQRFVMLMLVRSLAWVVAVWGFMFGMGFTGRYRLAIYLALGMLMIVAADFSDFEPSRFGLFSVVDGTFALERETLDLSAVATAMLFGLGWSLFGCALALAGEGNLAEGLAQRMSTREKSAVGALFVISIFIVSALDDKKQPNAFAFPSSAAVTRSESLPIEVAHSSAEHEVHARALLASLEADLQALPARLGWKVLPAVRVSWSGALDGRTFESVNLRDGDGVLLRAAFDAPDFDRVGFRAAVIRALLVAHTRGRADFEPYAFFLDGYARHVAEQQHGADAAHSSLMRALYATRDAPPTALAARRWHETRERLGPAMAQAVARSAVHALAAAGGEDAPDTVARRLFDGPSPKDLRASFELRGDAPRERVAEAAKQADFDAFVAHWVAHLDRLRTEPWAAGVAAMPRLSASVHVMAAAGELRMVTASLKASAAAPSDQVMTLLHQRLTPFDQPLEEPSLSRITGRWTAGSDTGTLQLNGGYGRGERAFFALEVELPAPFACPVRLSAERLVIP